MKRSNLRYIVPLSIVATLGIVIAAEAAFNGPPCSSPQSCNVDGVIWNKFGGGTQSNAAINIDGTAKIGNDVYLSNGKALRIDNSGASTYNVGNWGGAGGTLQPLTYTIYGDMKLNSFAPGGAGRKGQMDADWYCISGANCINAWPSGGGGGVTQLTAGTGVTLNPAGGTGNVTVNVADLYVNTTGDTMNGNLTMSNAYVNTTNLGGYGSYGWGVIGAYGRGYGVVGKGISGYAGADVTNGYAGHFDAQNAAGTSWGIYSRGSVGGGSGLFVNAGTTQSVELTNSLGNALVVNGPTALTGATTVNGKLTVVNPNQICLGLSGGVPDCRSSWPTGGTPGGANQQIQYNNGGAFAGSANFLWDNANNRMTLNGTTYLKGGGATGWNTHIPFTDGKNYLRGTTIIADGATTELVGIGTSAPNASYKMHVLGNMYSDGANAGYYFKDRTTANNWALYSTGDEVKLWSSVSGNQYVFHNNGIFVALGDIMTNGKLSGYTGTDSYGNVTLTNNVSPTTQSNLIMQKSGGIGFDGNRDNSAFLQLWTDNTFYWDMGTANRMLIRNSGSSSNLYDFNNGSLTITGRGNQPSFTTWGVTSDARLKDIRGNYTRGLDEISKLQPISYTYKPTNPYGYSSKTVGIGFSAQEVQKVIPEAVTTDSKGYLQLNSDPILWAQVNAIKQLKAENDALKAKNDELEARLDKIESRLNKLK
ncbi:MAG: tail fiber domain-containing protein [Patescibacteria group bacterium]